VSFTPSGGGTAARVTRATFPSEGETHWEIEASVDNINFYRIATVVVGTTTYDDSAATTSYSTNTLSDLTGRYTLQKSYKFVAMDQGRTIGFGSYTNTDKQCDLEFSAVVGSLDVGDVERVDTTAGYRLGLDENDGGKPTGLKGPINGLFFAFKDRQIWRLTPTGNTAAPYRADAISKSIGAVENVAIEIAEDKNGNPALYFMSQFGPYRYVLSSESGGVLEYIGRNIEPYIKGPILLINTTTANRAAITLRNQHRRQIWFWYATGVSTDPNVAAIFDIDTGAWSRVPSTDGVASIRCAVNYSFASGFDKRPWMGRLNANGTIWELDALAESLAGAMKDNSTNYTSSIITRDLEVGASAGPGYNGDVGDGELMVGLPAGSTPLRVAVTPDFGAQTGPTQDYTMAPAASEKWVSARVEGTRLGGIRYVNYTISDPSNTGNAWSLASLVVPMIPRGPLSQ
jgi:hypothetical protein